MHITKYAPILSHGIATILQFIPSISYADCCITHSVQASCPFSRNVVVRDRASNWAVFGTSSSQPQMHEVKQTVQQVHAGRMDRLQPMQNVPRGRIVCSHQRRQNPNNDDAFRATSEHRRRRRRRRRRADVDEWRQFEGWWCAVLYIVEESYIGGRPVTTDHPADPCSQHNSGYGQSTFHLVHQFRVASASDVESEQTL